MTTTDIVVVIAWGSLMLGVVFLSLAFGPLIGIGVGAIVLFHKI